MLRKGRLGKQFTSYVTHDRAEPWRFAFVGLFATAVDFLIFFILARINVSVIAANILAFFVANIFSYFANTAVTFRRDGQRVEKSVARYLQFLLAHLFGLATSTGVLVVATPVIGLLLAKAAATGVGFMSNYLLSSRLVFRNKPNNDGQ
ncbi:MAG: GtrA family protein [Pseudomonadota bacterium]